MVKFVKFAMMEAEMIRTVFIGILILLLSSSLLVANGLNLNSNGPKAIAMGGAFIGLADDFSAVYWNPAGLTQMEGTTIAFSLVDLMPSASYKMDLMGIDAQTDNKHYLSGSIGFFKPLPNNKIVMGIYGYVPSGVGSKWSGDDLVMLTRSGPYEWESMLAVITISPSIGVKLSDRFSLGASININYGMLTMKRPVVGQYEEDMTGLAVGFTFGALYKLNDKFSVGLSIKTPFGVKLNGDTTMPGAALYGLPAESPAERECTWPLWTGLGLAYHINDKITVTADLQYTNWGEMTDIPVNYENTYWAALFNTANRYELQWQDAVQLRFGFEYKVSESLALRCGYYHDPSPCPLRDADNTHNILLPQSTYNWGTLGFGYTKGNIKIEAAFEYGFGTDVTVGTNQVMVNSGLPGVHGIDIMAASVSMTIGL